MKLGPITKPDKSNTVTSKNVDDYVMSKNCDYGQFAGILEPGSRGMVYKTYIFININLLSYKTWKQN